MCLPKLSYLLKISIKSHKCTLDTANSKPKAKAKLTLSLALGEVRRAPVCSLDGIDVV